MDDHLLLMVSEVPTFDPRPKVISPSKPATLATSKQTWNTKIIQAKKYEFGYPNSRSHPSKDKKPR